MCIYSLLRSMRCAKKRFIFCAHATAINKLVFHNGPIMLPRIPPKKERISSLQRWQAPHPPNACSAQATLSIGTPTPSPNSVAAPAHLPVLLQGLRLPHHLLPPLVEPVELRLGLAGAARTEGERGAGPTGGSVSQLELWRLSSLKCFSYIL